MHSHEQFLSALESVRQRINAACSRSNRSPDEVKLMAVTKTHPHEVVNWAARAGILHVGENRVQEAAGKRPEGKSSPPNWELIGPLQSNKPRLAVRTFDRIQTVDRPKLVRVLDRICEEEGAELPVLLQVNVGEDPAKHGCMSGQARQLGEAILEARHLRLDGLMTIGELSEDETVVRGTFRRLRELRDRLVIELGCPLEELSMGMTGDLEWAIEEGSTLVRVGTALFGARGTYPPSS